MRAGLLVSALLVAGCNADPGLMPGQMGDDGGTTGTGPAMRFAVVGDSRPGNLNDSANYPAAIVAGNAALMHKLDLQFAVATGDYMFASTDAEVTKQVDQLLAAEAVFDKPIYRALGNHECTGATASNCPALNETANIRQFMARLAPKGMALPYYRFDVDTPKGKAKFVFVAANAWDTTQSNWLRDQLAEKTTYTFVVRHEPPDTTETPGVAPSESIIHQFPLTLELLGHSHFYKRVDAQHVISGNGGAPIRTGGGQGYGFLMLEQQDDGSIAASEIDEVSGNAIDSWKVSADGRDL
jgi:hypothetical protein